MTSGYITAPQCVPSRGGLLTGRYQNTFGLESNAQHKTRGGLEGFNNAMTIAERLKEVGLRDRNGGQVAPRSGSRHPDTRVRQGLLQKQQSTGPGQL